MLVEIRSLLIHSRHALRLCDVWRVRRGSIVVRADVFVKRGEAAGPA